MSEDSADRDRPVISSSEWIDTDDFRNIADVENITEQYGQKIQANELLNKTYVELERAEEINGWSAHKKKAVIAWRNELEFQYTVNWFFLYELKRLEGHWSWVVIVISTITSTLSLIDLEDFNWNDFYIKCATSAFSVATTLTAAWIKKENYVDRIKNIDRYTQTVSKLCVEIDSVLNKLSWDRPSFGQFIEVYEPQIQRLLADSPPLSPEELKTSVWKLTKYYPELVKNTYPWYEKGPDGEYEVTHWGKDILRTYDAVYYNSCWKKIVKFYYCKSKCCRKRANIAEIYEPRERQQLGCGLFPDSSLRNSPRIPFKFMLGPHDNSLSITRGRDNPKNSSRGLPTDAGKISITEDTKLSLPNIKDAPAHGRNVEEDLVQVGDS